jgi:crossover junction endodeoxyribonuclease RuvC
VIYGLDLSLTATGLAALGENNDLEVGTFGTKPSMRIEARLTEMAGQVARRIVAPDLVVIEGLAFGANDPSAHERAALHYIVRCNLWSDETRVLVVPPSTLKKFITGKGSAKKEMVILEVFKRWNVSAKDNNEADAAGLAYLGLAFLGRLDAMTVPMREVVSKLKEVR